MRSSGGLLWMSLLISPGRCSPSAWGTVPPVGEQRDLQPPLFTVLSAGWREEAEPVAPLEMRPESGAERDV